MPKNIFIPISFVLFIVFMWLVLPNGTTPSTPTTEPGTNVRLENGTQYIRITAKSGYHPKQIQAKANVPTIVEVETNGTYDCSSALTIPALGYRNALPATGITNITIAKEKATGTVDVLCSMGMYRSAITFIN